VGIQVLAAIAPGAAMDADDGGYNTLCPLWAIHIQQIFHAVVSVGDIPEFSDTLRQRDGCIPEPVGFGSS
jgi:hypothetical protein